MAAMLPIVIVVLVLALLVPVIVLAVRHQRAQDARRLEVWRGFAQDRGLGFVVPTGPWYRRTSTAVEGAVRGVPVRLDTYVVSTGKTHVTFTRVRAPLERDLAARVVVTRRNVFTGWGEALGWKTVPTGDSSFDAKFAARSPSRETAQGVLDDDVRARVAAFPHGLQIHCSGREAKIAWRNAESNPAVLEAGVELGAALGRACARA